VAVTDEEFLTARGGGRRGDVQRFPLDALARLRVVPNPHANLVEIEFAGTSPRNVTFMYDPRPGNGLDGLVDILREQASRPPRVRDGAPATAEAPAAQASPVAADEGAETTRRNRIILALLLVPLIGLYFAQVFLR
jgi:hypothetical protein